MPIEYIHAIDSSRTESKGSPEPLSCYLPALLRALERVSRCASHRVGHMELADDPRESVAAQAELAAVWGQIQLDRSAAGARDRSIWETYQVIPLWVPSRIGEMLAIHGSPCPAYAARVIDALRPLI